VIKAQRKPQRRRRALLLRVRLHQDPRYAALRTLHGCWGHWPLWEVSDLV